MLNFNQLTFQTQQTAQTQQITLVHQANGQVLPHDFILLTGQSGSGKSLLLKLLASLLPMTSGEISLNGTTLQQLTPAVWRSQIAYIAQMGEMIEGTVLDNLKLPFSLKFYQNQSFNPHWHSQQLANLGKSEAFLSQSSQLLSGGEKQLVNLLRTLQLNPLVLLLDEPTASLDNETTHQVEQLVQNWYQANSSASIVWISHEPTQIERLLAFGATHWRMANGHLTTIDE